MQLTWTTSAVESIMSSSVRVTVSSTSSHDSMWSGGFKATDISPRSLEIFSHRIGADVPFGGEPYSNTPNRNHSASSISSYRPQRTSMPRTLVTATKTRSPSSIACFATAPRSSWSMTVLYHFGRNISSGFMSVKSPAIIRFSPVL